MLTRAQASAALGVEVQAGEHIVRSATNLCGWAPPVGPSIAGKKLVLDFRTMQAFEIGKTPIKSMTKTPVSGIGDDAYYAPQSIRHESQPEKGHGCVQHRAAQ
jgi:hypothetical protein